MPQTHDLVYDSYTHETSSEGRAWHGAQRRSEYDMPGYLNGFAERAGEREKFDPDEQPSFFEACARRLAAQPFLLIVGYALHALLIAVHVALILIARYGGLDSAVFPLGPGTDRLSVILPATTQIVWASYLAILLLVTQELAMRKIFTTTQLLTGMHDGLSAWSGVGSALLGLFRQFSLPSSVATVFYIALYLVAAHVLHITAPSLITLVATNTTASDTVTFLHALPTMSPYTDTVNAAFTGAAGGLLPVLGKSAILTTPGLEGNVLYDVPVQNNSTGLLHVDVNINTVDVKCGYIPDVKQIGRKSDLTWTIGANHSGASFMFDLGLNETDANKYTQSNSLYMGLSLYDNPNHQFSNGSVYWPGSNDSPRPVDFSFPVTGLDSVAYPFYGPNVIFWSFVNISDDSNLNMSYVPLSPAYPVTFTVKEGTGTLGQGIQVIGCTISITQEKSVAALNADSHKVLHPEKGRGSPFWSVWEPALYNNKKSGQSQAELLGMIMTSTLRDKAAIPEYLSSQTGLPLTTYDASFANVHQPALIRLQKFEDALANASAAILWTAMRIGGLNANSLLGLNQTTEPVSRTVPALRLNINTVPLITGLIASCFLFIVFYIVTPFRSRGGPVVTGPGVLQILWLFADSMAQKRVATVSEEKASLNKLRKAGMFTVLASEVRDADGNVRQRTSLDREGRYESLGMQER